jgi:hypothetical protein
MNACLKVVAAAAALATLAIPAAAQNVEFMLYNNSSQTIHYFYASPSNSDDWSYDLLGDTGIIEAGAPASVLIGDGSDQCLYDFRFETAEGGLLEAWAVDICSLESYTITN